MRLVICLKSNHAEQVAVYLARNALQALLDEVRLTPKPGLVDARGSGVHLDLNLALMERSAYSLYPLFYAFALSGWQNHANRSLRQQIGRIGRHAEQIMMATTQGINTHRGAIWALGLLVTAAAMTSGNGSVSQLCNLAAKLAQIPDPASYQEWSNGFKAMQRYRVTGAREEAQQGFPHVQYIALPELNKSRALGANETAAQINALMAIMSTLTDTCVLSRGGLTALHQMHNGAQQVLAAGGYQDPAGQRALNKLEQQLFACNASPGGAADLLAATLFLDRIALY